MMEFKRAPELELICLKKKDLFVCLFFRDRISLCSPGCPGTHSVDQAGLKLQGSFSSLGFDLHYFLVCYRERIMK